jgi:dienelactone hydrolase
VEAYARRGISTAVMTLPYHRERRHPGKSPGGPYVNDDPRRQRQALEQAVADVATIVSWLREQPAVDPDRIGITGISLGALITHLAMGQDSRLVAGVAMLGGGNLPCVQKYRPRLITRRLGGRFDDQEMALMKPVDPLTYADQNQPRQVLMFEGARDWIFPPRCAEGFWEALGRPPIIWLDAGHIVPVRIEASAARTSAAYLASVFEGNPKQVNELPRAYVPTFKIGLISGLGTLVTPAVQWQAITLLKRPDHMSLLHADLGLTGRGPFLGLAATLTNHADFGLGYRFLADAIRPYFSFHIVP